VSDYTAQVELKKWTSVSPCFAAEVRERESKVAEAAEAAADDDEEDDDEDDAWMPARGLSKGEEKRLLRVSHAGRSKRGGEAFGGGGGGGGVGGAGNAQPSLEAARHRAVSGRGLHSFTLQLNLGTHGTHSSL
jgi:hypothetical protein